MVIDSSALLAILKVETEAGALIAITTVSLEETPVHWALVRWVRRGR